MNGNLKLSDEASALLDYWRDARGGSLLPHRSWISPIELRRWVGDVSVIHLHEGEKRFFVSLHGANVAHHIGPDFNKKYLEDAVSAASLPASIAPYLESIARRAAIYAVMVPSISNNLYSRLERMILPFCDTNPEAVERFLVWVAPNSRNTSRDSSIYESGALGNGSVAMFDLEGAEPTPL